MKWLVIIGVILVSVAIFACLNVSSRCSREEEQRDGN